MADVVYDVPVPTSCWDRVNGHLWMGGSMERPTGFGAVVSLDGSVGRFPGLAPDDRTLHLVWGITDGPCPDLPTLGRVVAFVRDQVERGVGTLVRGAAGLNRSGLICAATLVAQGWTAEDAIGRVRHARTKHALCNEQFVALIEALAREADRG